MDAPKRPRVQIVLWSSQLHCIFKHTHRQLLVATPKTSEALESPCSPPTHRAAPLPSLIHPHQGPECLLSLSALHYLLSFRVPCSSLWGHLVFGVGCFFRGVQDVLYSVLPCRVKTCFSRVTLLTSWPLIDWINACRDQQCGSSSPIQLTLACAWLTVFQ